MQYAINQTVFVNYTEVGVIKTLGGSQSNAITTTSFSSPLFTSTIRVFPTLWPGSRPALRIDFNEFIPSQFSFCFLWLFRERKE
jgi:hypothetical protein